MFNQFGNSDHTFSDSRPNVRQAGAAVVYDVILDEENESIKDGDKDLSTIGAIKYREFGNLVSSEEDLSTAFPFNSFITELPVRNEIVQIFKSSTGKSFYRRIESSPFKTGATVSTFISKTFPKQSSFNGASSDYQRVQSTGIERRNTTTSDVYDGYGDYFQHEFAKRLKLYEGDTLLESRFGQSIRFSAYNNDNKAQHQ